MRKTVFFFVLLVCLLCQATIVAVPARSFSQSPIDSLKQLTRKVTAVREKYTLYGQISWAYLSLRTSDGLELAKQFADSIRLLGEKSNDDYGRFYAHFYYGYIEKQKGNYNAALDRFDEFVGHRISIGDSIAVAHGLYQMGVISNQIGNSDTALGIYYRILKIYETAHRHKDVGNTLNSIGIILKNMKRYEEAIKTYNQALAIFDSIDEKYEQVNVMANLANIYAERSDFKQASIFFRRTLKIEKALNDQWGIAMDLENIGTMKILLQEYDSALIYELNALAIRKELSSRAELGVSYNKVGNAYFKLSKVTLALDYYAKCLAIAKEINEKPLLRDLYQSYAELYSSQHDFEKAFAYEKLYEAQKDSILNELNVRILNELQTRYDTEKKDLQIVVLSKEKELQEKEAQRQSTLKKASLAGLILVALLAISIGYFSRQKLKTQNLISTKDNEIKEVNYKRQMGELEMKALRAQINPHFLFNCMNSINRMILDEENTNASLYLAKFSKLVRMILENAERSRVSLQNELTLLESYIQLEGLRFKGTINYKITIDEGIDPDDLYLPSMVLQPFVENAIWHGLMHRGGDDAGLVEITVRQKEGRLFCTIQDNGVGRARANELEKESTFKTKSMGMKITEERLRLLSKERWDKLVHIIDLKDSFNMALGTRVEISIPVS